MIIKFELNGNPYCIEVEGNCYQANKIVETGLTDKSGNATKNPGLLKFDVLGYFTKLSNAALRCCREEISTCRDVVNLKEFAARVEALNKQLTDQLDAIAV